MFLIYHNILHIPCYTSFPDVLVVNIYFDFTISGVESPLLFMGSHMIDKSPPIGSIPRGPSWKDSDSSHHPPKRFITKERDEEHECINLVKALLSEAHLHGEALERWHSLESPLDPSLRGKSIDFKDEKKLHDSKLRQKRAFQNLVYDCINSALADARNEPHGVDPCIRSYYSTPSTILDEVWSNIKVWLSSEVRDMVDDSGENDSLVVEKVIRKEVEGKGWSHHFRLEIDNLGKEIEERLLEELTHEMVVEFKGFHLFNYS